eukprot:SAG11_NODE_36354_length_262_cov_0.619632_1_plen_39_part_10
MALTLGEGCAARRPSIGRGRLHVREVQKRCPNSAPGKDT